MTAGTLFLLLGFNTLLAQEVVYSAGPLTGAQNLQGLGFSWADYNQDGTLDLFVEPDNLVRNNNGTSFTRISGSGIAFNVAMVGSMWADFNGDGYPDIMTTQGGSSPRLYQYNPATGLFTDVTTTSGALATISSGSNGQMYGLAAADYNRDGFLDIAWAGAANQNATSGRVRLLRGGATGFTSVGGASAAPALDTLRFFESWNPHFVDANNDGNIDLFLPSFRNSLLTTGTGCVLYLNNGNGTFSPPATAGADTGLVIGSVVRKYSAIASAWGDYNNDGIMDLALSALGGEERGNGLRLLRGNGNSTFTEVTTSGITYNNACRALYWGDYNNDGFTDLLQSRGFAPPTVWRNNGNGTFTDISAAINIPAAGFNTRSVGFIDYNGDGFLDIYGVPNGDAGVLRNGGNLNNWIAFKAQGSGNNGLGVGARFTVYTNGGTTKQIRNIEAGGSGGATGGSVWANFGLGVADRVDSVAVIWPNGSRQTFTGLAVNRYWTIKQGSVFPNVPVLASPADNATGQSGSLTLSWNAAAGAATYRVQVSLDQAFADAKRMAVDRTVTGTSLAVNLGLGSTYYWRVSATNGGFTSAYSTVNRFSTVATAATAVVRLVSPASGATNQAALLPLVVRRTADAAQYRYQVSTLRSFAAFTVNQLNVDTTNTVQLFSGTKYYWRVRGENGAGVAAFSNIDSFTVMTAPAVPALVSPANNAQNVRADTLRLFWRLAARASSYKLELSNSSASGLVVREFTTADTSLQVTGLQRLTTYFWRVQAINIGGPSLFSGSNSFVTLIAAPAAPAAVAPAANAVDVSVLPTFSWSEVVTATKYRVQVASDNQFATVVRDTVVFERTSVKLVRPLQGETPYFWRVSAGNIGGESAFSTARLFTTASTVGVAEDRKTTAIPTEFGLSQNYPNPFNPTTTIQFALPKSSEVKLVIYDLAGRVVMELANGKFEAGYHKVVFDATRLVSGIYYYRLKAGDFLSVKKLTLLK